MEKIPNTQLLRSIVDACQPIIGQPIWGICQGHGTALFLEFGDPSMELRQPRKSTSDSEKVRRHAARRHVRLRGRWSFTVFPGTWLLEQEDGTRIESDDVQTVERDGILSEFNGQYLKSVEFDPAAIQLRFAFDLGATMVIGQNPDIDDELLLFTPQDGPTYGLGLDGLLTTDSAEK